MRTSLYLEGSGRERIIIDTGPEFRIQAVRAGINGLDAVLLTHSHADHLNGLDDLRPLSCDKPLPVYGNEETLNELRERFSYIFKETQAGGGKPRLVLHVPEGPIRIGGLLLTPIPVKHGSLDILSWYITEEPAEGNPPDPPEASDTPAPKGLLYMTDTSAVPESSRALLSQPQFLIIGGLRQGSHPTHFSFEEAIEEGLRIGAPRIFLTHICHNHSHREIIEYCTDYMKKHHINGIAVSPAWDGLELSV
jgi:phosphoribosyl 1,2-cyclic phosphate phosphodiesterase